MQTGDLGERIRSNEPPREEGYAYTADLQREWNEVFGLNPEQALVLDIDTRLRYFLLETRKAGLWPAEEPATRDFNVLELYFVFGLEIEEIVEIMEIRHRQGRSGAYVVIEEIRDALKSLWEHLPPERRALYNLSDIPSLRLFDIPVTVYAQRDRCQSAACRVCASNQEHVLRYYAVYRPWGVAGKRKGHNLGTTIPDLPVNKNKRNGAGTSKYLGTNLFHLYAYLSNRKTSHMPA